MARAICRLHELSVSKNIYRHCLFSYEPCHLPWFLGSKDTIILTNNRLIKKPTFFSQANIPNCVFREMSTSLPFWRKTVTLCCLDSGIHGINSTFSSGAESSPMAGKQGLRSAMYFWQTISGTPWCWQYLDTPSLSLWTAASPQMCMWSTYSGVI